MAAAPSRYPLPRQATTLTLPRNWRWQWLALSALVFASVTVCVSIEGGIPLLSRLIHTSRFWTLALVPAVFTFPLTIPYLCSSHLDQERKKYGLPEIQPKGLFFVGSFLILNQVIRYPELIVDPTIRTQLLPPAWSTTSGTVVGPCPGACQGDQWCPQILYSYTVRGQAYQSTRVGTHCFSMDKKVRDFYKSIPTTKGGKVTVFYDSQDPAYAWLRLPPTDNDVLGPAKVMLLVAGAGFVLSLYGLLIIGDRLRAERRSLKKKSVF